VTAQPDHTAARDTLWRFIGLVLTWLSFGAVLLLTGAEILSTAIKWVNA
jgi:hypothetical protein